MAVMKIVIILVAATRGVDRTRGMEVIIATRSLVETLAVVVAAVMAAVDRKAVGQGAVDRGATALVRLPGRRCTSGIITLSGSCGTRPRVRQAISLSCNGVGLVDIPIERV